MSQYGILLKGVDFWNLWRYNNPEIKSDLTGENLSNLDLKGINFSGTTLTFCNLKNTNLNSANLYQAEFFEADLTNSNMSFADIRGGKFHDANLTNSLLESAQLFRVDFINTILDGTNFLNAICFTTAFSNVDLSRCINLEKIRHIGPSNIDIFTFYKSANKIPLNFLIGAGIPAGFIKNINSTLNKNPLNYYSCFISYSHKNKAFANKLYEKLQKHDVRCWLDEHQIKPGEKIYEAVDKGIKNWDKILLCCSKESLNSWWVNDEISKALKKEQISWTSQKEDTLTIIPLNLDDYLFQWEGAIANQLKDRLALDFTEWERNEDEFNKQFSKLIIALKI